MFPIAAIRHELTDMSDEIGALRARLAVARQDAEALLAASRADIDRKLRLGGLRGSKLLSDAVTLDGPPSARMRVRRLGAGDPVARAFRQWVGITRCVSRADDVRSRWEQLLAAEAATDGVLRGNPASVLEVPAASVSIATRPVLHVSLAAAAPGGNVALAVPRFAHALASRKLRNFSHWLLDCLPQVVALRSVAGDADFLLPPLTRAFQQATLSLVGLSPDRVLTWEGAALAADRVFVLESDGRAGGGRPLSPLLTMRTLLGAPAKEVGHRRIYVSRRDAKAKRRWMSNELAVEQLFERRGFEVLSISERPFAEVVQAFREAAVVAGVNGAGLAHILFSPPGIHVITLFSDSLIRWHAGEGARALWTADEGESAVQLTALGDSPRFYAHVAAAFGQSCHSFVGPDEVPLDQLASFLDEVHLEAGRR